MICYHLKWSVPSSGHMRAFFNSPFQDVWHLANSALTSQKHDSSSHNYQERLSSSDFSGCLMVKMMELKEQYILVAPQFWLGYHLKIYLQFRHSSWTCVRCWGWAAERETRGPFFRTAGDICHGELKSTFSKIHFCESIMYIYVTLNHDDQISPSLSALEGRIPPKHWKVRGRHEIHTPLSHRLNRCIAVSPWCCVFLVQGT